LKVAGAPTSEAEAFGVQTGAAASPDMQATGREIQLLRLDMQAMELRLTVN